MMPAWLLIIPFLILGACSKRVVYDREAPPTPAPAPARVTLPERAAGDGTPPVPERVISLNVVQVRPESWWKTCLTITVNGDEANKKLVGCNKASGPGGQDPTQSSPVSLGARKDVCNVLSLRMTVHKNLEPCVQGQACESRYADTEDWARATTSAADRAFFKFRRGNRILPLDADMRLTDAVANALPDVEKAATTFLAVGTNNGWVRVFFEDQNDKNFAEAQSAPAERARELGLDFNDFIVDLKGENVKFKVEGSNETSGCE